MLVAEFFCNADCSRLLKISNRTAIHCNPQHSSKIYCNLKSEKRGLSNASNPNNLSAIPVIQSNLMQSSSNPEAIKPK